MLLSDVFKEVNVVPDLSAKDKNGLIEELAEVVVRSEPSIKMQSLVQVLLEREKLGSTGIGDGVAIPHGKLAGIDKPVVAFGRSKKGINFEAMDDQPADLFFLLVAPENTSGMHLQLLAKIARLLGSSSVRKKLREGKTRWDLFKTITDSDQEL
ncbi:MAG: PTS fructose transporter subunit IIA [Deltaproteobacteria bacterium CG_4_8_14_3_um_filter_51_11]|nr:PTS sugar transporter subunit IIA [bacterium]OIP38070.1 MAG: PTS fructose transporter subunit IIA [Desulfobacteraceae bacterium CG2_30_51_40]PIP47058.1 MAG: PTS fructose transporter subunit IIA [Deltaproteobacteria bacterium CG23_combo_of_CG06-09_8_20_14_all_51_20]PIV99465.1 MAG: PTS fructose transporter subunit IIA [Deltaproteobacteria bacterium CG17_big_fil_post_rev_8_21_14_2_50_51_6]PIX18682.1 MAG: PTS fructose transporter subunit IIA [Deltaproteobacteria bacterium CG_4_8_14_3_um_filter_5